MKNADDDDLARGATRGDSASSRTAATDWIHQQDVGDYWEIRGRQCAITIEPRPSYCDRGNYVAKLFPEFPLSIEIDGADGWPRYYFDLAIAKAECVAWLRKRG